MVDAILVWQTINPFHQDSNRSALNVTLLVLIFMELPSSAFASFLQISGQLFISVAKIGLQLGVKGIRAIKIKCIVGNSCHFP